MHADLLTRRRVLMLTYRRYQEADRAWTMALEELKGWFPLTSRPGAWAIGNPGSSIRRLHDQRDLALHQLQVAHCKLETARHRLVEQHQKRRVRQILLVSYQVS